MEYISYDEDDDVRVEIIIRRSNPNNADITNEEKNAGNLLWLIQHYAPETLTSKEKKKTKKKEKKEEISVYKYRYKKSRVLKCSICQDNFYKDQKVKKLCCKHIYHEECINKWMERSNTCPICRKDIIKKQDTQKEKE
jgi:hypothetical protein